MHNINDVDMTPIETKKAKKKLVYDNKKCFKNLNLPNRCKR